MDLPQTIGGARVEHRPGWRSWVTPRNLLVAPVHRWFVFPHSFSAELVNALIGEWRLTGRSTVLDPFVGAGTTLVACQELGVPSIGIDLSPLACLAARAKTSTPTPTGLRRACESVTRRLKGPDRLPNRVGYDDLITRAFSGRVLSTLDRAKHLILDSGLPSRERNALLLALLRVLPLFSRLVNKGGWLTEVDDPLPAAYLVRELGRQVEVMAGDLERRGRGHARAEIRRADVRTLPLESSSVSSIITSPPYPNRHDYTRVFGVELQFAFLDAERIRQLRYQSFHSHPEAHPARPQNGTYREPAALSAAIDEIESLITDSRAKHRIPRMLHGYFHDMYLGLYEMRRVLRPGARAALVVGNVQYYGRAIEVDRFTAVIGRQVGLEPERIIVTRHRGNSAQQMKDYGRQPQRESLVILRRPR